MNISPSPIKLFKGMKLGIVTSEQNILLTYSLNLVTSFHQLRGHITLVKHSIPTTRPPIRQPVRRVPEALKSTINHEVDQMLDQNIIRPSTSPWASPVVMVWKSDGSWRFCVHYCWLNSITHRDTYPLPRIDATLDSLVGCKYLTTLDLASGYWQVALEEEDYQCPCHLPGADGMCSGWIDK